MAEQTLNNSCVIVFYLAIHVVFYHVQYSIRELICFSFLFKIVWFRICSSQNLLLFLCTICLFKMNVLGALSYNFSTDLALHIYCVAVLFWQVFSSKHDKSVEASHMTIDKKQTCLQTFQIHHFFTFFSWICTCCPPFFPRWFFSQTLPPKRVNDSTFTKTIWTERLRDTKDIARILLDDSTGFYQWSTHQWPWCSGGVDGFLLTSCEQCNQGTKRLFRVFFGDGKLPSYTMLYGDFFINHEIRIPII